MSPTRWITLPLLIASCLPGFETRSAEIVLTAVADTSLWQRETNHNLGGAPFLPAGTVGSDGGGNKTHLLVRFDLEGALPERAVVESAKIYLRIVRAPNENNAVNSTFRGRRVLKDWGEGNKDYQDPATPMTSTTNASPGEATWGHRFFGDDSKRWAQGGGDFTDNDFAEAYDFAFSAGLFADRDVEAGVNGEGLFTLNDWVADPDSNFGWVITSESPYGGTARQFAASENSVEEYRPQLTITYNVPGPREPVIQSIEKNGTTIRVVYQAEAGVMYLPQWTEEAVGLPWFDLRVQGPLNTDGLLQFDDDVGGMDGRFYQVIVFP